MSDKKTKKIILVEDQKLFANGLKEILNKYDGVDVVSIIDNGLILTIDDNGNGFDTSNANLLYGNGINNMKSRIESIDGSFEISSTTGKGTYIVISVPLK